MAFCSYFWFQISFEMSLLKVQKFFGLIMKNAQLKLFRLQDFWILEISIQDFYSRKLWSTFRRENKATRFEYWSPN